MNGFEVRARGTDAQILMLSPALTPPTDHIIYALSIFLHKASAWVMKSKYLPPRLFYPARLLFKKEK